MEIAEFDESFPSSEGNFVMSYTHFANFASNDSRKVSFQSVNVDPDFWHPGL